MSFPEYLEFTFTHSLDSHDILIAFLWQHNFESFVEETNYIIGYISKDIDLDSLENALKTIPVKFEYSYRDLPPQNWNTSWESNFEPVVVNDFCAIRADFHPRFPDHEYEITINPKQAFGTGHHETTFMMIEYLQQLDLSNKCVADIGSGTGILAILAEKLGAIEVLATDFDPIAVENCIENVQSNQCDRILVADENHHLQDHYYDIILANINQPALITYQLDFFRALKSNGVIILSGILNENISVVKEAYASTGFSYTDHKEKGEWVAIQLCKK